MKIDHIAIAVDDVQESAKLYSSVLGIDKVEFETISSEGVKIAILHLENARIELMEPMNDSSPIKKFLDKKGPGLHHMAIGVDNIDDKVSKMKDDDVSFLGDIRDGSDKTRVAFIHPKSLGKVLVELCSD